MDDSEHEPVPYASRYYRDRRCDTRVFPETAVFLPARPRERMPRSLRLQVVYRRLFAIAKNAVLRFCARHSPARAGAAQLSQPESDCERRRERDRKLREPFFHRLPPLLPLQNTHRRYSRGRGGWIKNFKQKKIQLPNPTIGSTPRATVITLFTPPT